MNKFDMDEEEFLLQYFDKSPILIIKDVQSLFYENVHKMIKSFFVNINSKTSSSIYETELENIIAKFVLAMQPNISKACDNFELKSIEAIFSLPSDFHVDNHETFSEIKSNIISKMCNMNEFIGKIEWARKEKKEIQEEIFQLDQSIAFANHLIDQVGQIISSGFDIKTNSTQELLNQLRNSVTERNVTLKSAKDYFDNL